MIFWYFWENTYTYTAQKWFSYAVKIMVQWAPKHGSNKIPRKPWLDRRWFFLLATAIAVGSSKLLYDTLSWPKKKELFSITHAGKPNSYELKEFEEELVDIRDQSEHVRDMKVFVNQYVDSVLDNLWDQYLDVGSKHERKEVKKWLTDRTEAERVASACVDYALIYGVPLEYLIAMVQSESHFGTQWRGDTHDNPMNVGNTDDGNNIKFSNTLWVKAWTLNLRSRRHDYFATFPSRDHVELSELVSNRDRRNGYGFMKRTSLRKRYKHTNPYRGKWLTPHGSFMTAREGMERVDNLVEKFLAAKHAYEEKRRVQDATINPLFTIDAACCSNRPDRVYYERTIVFNGKNGLQKKYMFSLFPSKSMTVREIKELMKTHLKDKDITISIQPAELFHKDEVPANEILSIEITTTK